MTTRFTLASSATFAIYPFVRIVIRICMALRTMCGLSMNSCKSYSSNQVLPARYDLKMVWIHTTSDATQMVNVHAKRYFTTIQFIGNPVGVTRCFFSQSYGPVSVRLASTHPNPTPRFCDWNKHRVEPITQWPPLSSHVSKVHSRLHPVCMAIMSKPIFGLTRPAFDA